LGWFSDASSRDLEKYGLPVRFESSKFTSARWVHGTREAVEAFVAKNKGHIATDNDGDTVYLTRLQWDIDRVERDHPELRLSAMKEMMV
jgi:peptide chain release factor 3